MTLFASRLSRIHPSPTLAMIARAASLKAQGHNILSLSAGEPDFDTPDFIKEAAIKAMDLGMTKYTPVDGLLDLKKAIQSKFLRDNQLAYELDELTVANGAKQIIFNALLSTVESGDEVIIPAPYWVSYPDMVNLVGGTPVIVSCPESNGFKLTPAQLKASITPRTKWLILNSPSNPTGAVYSKGDLLALTQVLLENPHVYVLSDDIYEHLIFDGMFHALASLEPRLKERVLTVNGPSKTYAMTGWRIGYAGGPKALIKAMSLIQSQSTSSACSISQAASIAALTGSQEFIQEWREVYRNRRNQVLEEIEKILGLSCLVPQGTFYVYVNCEGLLGKQTENGKVLSTDNDVIEYFLEEAEVAVMGGDSFGLSPYFRISIAASQAVIQESLERLRQSIERLSG